MKYIVIKPFQDISGFKMPGESIELDTSRAAKLRVNGLIGGEFKSPIETTQKDMEQLTGIYPESKVYAKKLESKKKVK